MLSISHNQSIKTLQPPKCRNLPLFISTVEPMSAETVASIDDILTQILLKLPIKPLTRFKLINKHVLSLITTHNMRNPTPNPAHGIILRIKGDTNCQYYYDYIPLHKNSSEPPPFNRSFSNKPVFTTVIHSCNGLLLCEIDDETIDVFDEPFDTSMYVYNPTTNMAVTLPGFGIGTRYGPTLAFDPVQSSHYKVVMAVRVESAKGCAWEVRVYSSETGGWCFGAEIGTEERRGVNFGNGVFWNGSVHWLTEKLTGKDSGMSLRFNVDIGVLEDMVSPPVVQDQSYRYRSNYYFGESCDHLHFVEVVLPRFNVYEMKRDYSEWFVKYRVDLSAFIGDHPEMIKKGCFGDSTNYYVVYVLSLVRGEKDEDSRLVLRIPSQAVKVNLVDGTWDKLYDIPYDNICGSFGSDAGVHSGMYYFVGERGLDYIQCLCSV